MGKIQSVTNDNVAEYVADRKALGSEVKTEDQSKQEDAKVKTQGVKTAPETQPDLHLESKPPESEKGKAKNSVQDRIDELTRQKKELDEFAQTEYEARLQAQRRIAELESQIQVTQSPRVKEEPEPVPDVYVKDGIMDQKKFLEDWGKWQRNKAIAEFKAEEEKQRQEDDKKHFIAEAETRRKNSLEAARKEFPDFDEKIEEARESVEMKTRASPNGNVAALLAESDYGAHILYHLTQHPEDVDKWNKMRPSQVAIAIGRLETQFAKPVEADKGAPDSPKPKLPEPIPSLGAGGGTVTQDLSQPIPFNAYKQKRIEEIRKKHKR